MRITIRVPLLSVLIIYLTVVNAAMVFGATYRDYDALHNNLTYEFRNEDVYDDITAFGDQYVLLKKTESGFSSSEVLYGVYDWESDEWLMEFQSFPGFLRAHYLGEGMFLLEVSNKVDNDYLVNPFDDSIYEIPHITDDWYGSDAPSSGEWFCGGHMVAHTFFPEEDGRLLTDSWGQFKNQDLQLICADGTCERTTIETEYDCKGKGKVVFRGPDCFAVLLNAEDSQAIGVYDYDGSAICLIEDLGNFEEIYLHCGLSCDYFYIHLFFVLSCFHTL